MAKLYVLSDEHIKSGKRPKTPKDKAKRMVKILSALLILETIVLTYVLGKHF